MVKKIINGNLNNYNRFTKKDSDSYIDLSFNDIYSMNEDLLKVKILKKAFKTKDKQKANNFRSLNIDALKNHFRYDISVNGVNKNGDKVKLGTITEYTKITPKELYMKYAPTFLEWISNNYFVDKSGEHYAWKEKVELLSRKNQFLNSGVPTDFQVRLHFIS